MSCRILWYGLDTVAWECSPNEWGWLQAQCEAEERAWELEQDLEIERELGRWPRMTPETEPADVEYVDAVFVQGA
jgi:hypothetical protein